MVISHLIGNTPALVACSLVSHSWHTAAFPHRHNTLITSTSSYVENKRFTWPEPLLRMGELGFLPFVRKFQFGGFPPVVSPRLFNRCALRHFYALTNVQELRIDGLDIPSFVPRIQRYFGHFTPTVRSLVLKEPRGSGMQLIYFIGLFEHLEDLKVLHYVHGSPEGGLGDRRALTPPFVPPLRGRLTITDSNIAGFLEEMICRFGGGRFRWVHPHNVDEARGLLDACAERLETLRLDLSDICGRCCFLNFWVPTDDFTR